MGTRRKLVILGVFVVVVVGLGSWLGRQIFARPLFDSDHIIFTPDEIYQASGSTDRPLVVIAEEIRFDANSQIPGDSAFIGDVIDVAGQVNGDITLMGDSIAVSAIVNGNASLIGANVNVTGDVTGNLTVVGENLTIAQGAVIGGKIVACADNLSDTRPDATGVEQCSDEEAWTAFNTAMQFDTALWNGGFSALALLASGFASLVLTGVSALAVAAFPRQISYIEEAILTAPRRAGQTGIMTALLAVGLTVGVVLLVGVIPPLGLIALPVFGLATIVFVGMTVSGWITVALIIGNWLLRRVTRGVPPLITVAVGSLVLFVVWHVVGLLPFGVLLVLVAMAVLGSVGLGGVVATRLGTRPVRRRYFVQG
jgi:hypothetical protein